MPHNRTRIWVGLAIAAITIPALGLAYYRPQSNLQANASTDGRWSAGSQLRPLRGARSVPSRLASTPAPRDYLAEVAGKLGRNVPNAADGTLAERTQQNYDGYDLVYNEMADAYVPDYGSDLPDPAAAMAPDAPTAANGYDDGTFDDTSLPPPDDGMGGVVADQGPSDREIYNEMLASFTPEERDTFVRTWALMSPEQRADVLDDYRGNN